MGLDLFMSMSTGSPPPTLITSDLNIPYTTPTPHPRLYGHGGPHLHHPYDLLPISDRYVLLSGPNIVNGLKGFTFMRVVPPKVWYLY